jgi:uncharacterized protein YkwD
MKANFTRSLAWTVRLGASAAALFLVSCGSTSVPTATELTTMVAPSSNMSMDNQVAARIENFRSSNGLSGQTRHSGLDKLARMHAQRMLARGKMDHANYNQRLGMAESYYKLGGLRENVAHGKGFSRSDMSRVMVEGWIGSKGHRANLLSKTSHYGVGIAIGEDGSFYSVQLTANPVKAPGKSAFRPGMPNSYSNNYGASMGPVW